MSEDPVVDFIVMEAVFIKASAEEQDARIAAEKQNEVKEFKSDFTDLEQYR
jgi:hypothetical protein